MKKQDQEYPALKPSILKLQRALFCDVMLNKYRRFSFGTRLQE